MHTQGLNLPKENRASKSCLCGKRKIWLHELTLAISLHVIEENQHGDEK
jgi:hypothetical protein